jgi:hypothetical protein
MLALQHDVSSTSNDRKTQLATKKLSEGDPMIETPTPRHREGNDLAYSVDSKLVIDNDELHPYLIFREKILIAQIALLQNELECIRNLKSKQETPTL